MPYIVPATPPDMRAYEWGQTVKSLGDVLLQAVMSGQLAQMPQYQVQPTQRGAVNPATLQMGTPQQMQGPYPGMNLPTPAGTFRNAYNPQALQGFQQQVNRGAMLPSSLPQGLTATPTGKSKLQFLPSLTRKAQQLQIQQAESDLADAPLKRKVLESEAALKSGQAGWYKGLMEGKMGDVPVVRDPTSGEIRPALPGETPTMVLSRTKTGDALKGYPDTEATRKQAEQSKARESLRTYSEDAVQTLTALEKIERESRNLGDFGRGVLPQTMAHVKTGVGQFAKSKDITRYTGVIAQELIPAARKLMEEKGPITEWDVARVEKGLGELTVPLEDKLFLLNELRDKVRRAISNKLESAGITPEEFLAAHPTLGTLFGEGGLGTTPTDTNIQTLQRQFPGATIRRKQ